jgi:hypothetical protein
LSVHCTAVGNVPEVEFTEMLTDAGLPGVTKSDPIFNDS